MGMRLAGKVAIVTGGGAGIGEAICKVFAREGASVVIAGLPGDPVAEVCSDIGRMGMGHSMPFEGDLADEATAEACVRFAVEQFGRVDILINNAGIFPEQAELQESSVSAFDQLIHSNIRTAYLMSRAALPELHKTRGCIVNASSEAGLIGEPQIAACSGSKGWMLGFTRSLGNEQLKYGVRVNAVAPGPIDTEMTRPDMGGAMSEDFAQMAVEGTPMGRRGTPEEVANAYLFLASDEASYITAAVLPVDGGSSATKGTVSKFVPDDLKQPPAMSITMRRQMDGRGSLG